MDEAEQMHMSRYEGGAPAVGEDTAGSKTEAAKDSARHVAAETQERTGELARETADQVRHVVGQASGEARQQADVQAARAASGLQTMAQQLRALSDGRPGDAGPIVDYARRASNQMAQWSHRLETGGAQGVMSDVARYARRRPGQFLLVAAGAGFVAGRLVRAAKGEDGSPTVGSRHDGRQER